MSSKNQGFDLSMIPKLNVSNGQTFHLNENQLRQIIKESIKKVLNENWPKLDGEYQEGKHYNIYVDGYPEYYAVPGDKVNELYTSICQENYAEEIVIRELPY